LLQKQKNDDSGRFLAVMSRLTIWFDAFMTFSNRIIISPVFFPFLPIKVFLRPFDGDPNISPTVLSAFPTSLGGLSK